MDEVKFEDSMESKEKKSSKVKIVSRKLLENGTFIIWAIYSCKLLFVEHQHIAGILSAVIMIFTYFGLKFIKS